MKIAVAIPSYKVQNHVLDVIARMPPQVRRIYVIDDKCPNGSGELVRQQCSDPRVRVIFHEENQGVGGAVRTGYQAALDEGMDIVVKVDGDGQMDPALIPHFTRPIDIDITLRIATTNILTKPFAILRFLFNIRNSHTGS